jgi:hypothetical protein
MSRLRAARALSPRAGPRQPGDVPVVRSIPFDHVTSFNLIGRLGMLHEDVINVGVEGVFIAEEIGYGFAPQRLTAMSASDLRGVDASGKLAELTLGQLAPHILIDGFRINPVASEITFPDGVLSQALTIADAFRMKLLQRVDRSGELHFLFQIVDSGTGRELQNIPMHSVASLGKANGERPFRPLSRPIAFLPRSAIRVQVEEASCNTTGELVIALHGYKVLGAADASEVELRAAPPVQRAPTYYGQEKQTTRLLQSVQQGRVARDRVVPFDYVATFDLEGRRGNLIPRDISVNVEGGFTATGISYSLEVRRTGVEFTSQPAVADPQKVAELTLAHFRADSLMEGFRIGPDRLCLAFKEGSLAQLPRSTVLGLFHGLNRPEDVLFKFRIVDSGTGRELQDNFELNTAGLGTADGGRPFRELPYPMRFLPRSTIRLQVEEIAGRGRLFIVLQGYKILKP